MNQASTLAERWTEPADTAGAPLNPAMREYEARRCRVCQCKYPSFGFGFPITRKGQTTIWACGTHRLQVDQMLTGSPGSQHVPPQSSLL